MRKGRQHISALAALVLFGLFAGCVLAVLLTGAGAYRRLTGRDRASCESRTRMQYVAARVRQADGGTVEEFAKLMNQKAGELGCQDTHFVTPNGLDDSDEGGIHATTARDLATIMRYCIKQSPCREEFLEITRTKNYQFSDVDGGRSFSCVNHNAFLDMMDGALTGKTGFTSDAGYCYVGALERDGRTFIVALLACGWPNNKSYKWTDTRKLMEYGIANYQYRDVWEDVVLPDVEVKNGVEEESPYETELYMPVCVEGKEEIPLLLRADEGVEIKTEVKDSLTAPVSKGDVVGSVRYILEGEEIASYQVVAGEDIRERDLNWALCWIVRLALM